jgi:hypothetical protein
MNRLLSGALALVLTVAGVLSPVALSQQLDRFSVGVASSTDKQHFFPSRRIDADAVGTSCGTNRIGETTVATVCRSSSCSPMESR